MRTIFLGAQEKPNGVNSYTYNLASELKKRGMESSVISFGSCKKISAFEGVDILQYKTPGGSMTSIPVLYFKALSYIIKHRKDVDMVMFQTVQFSVIPSLIVRMSGIKTSSIIHSLAEDSPKHGNLMKKILRFSMKLALGLTKNVITVSDTKAEEVYNRYGKKCVVVPCGVNLPEDRELHTDVLSKNNISSGKYFLSIGRIDPIKNLEVLIDAFKSHKHDGYQLVIGGDTDNPYGRTVVERAADCKDIIFSGLVQGDTKSALLKNCMAYCLVSSSEGLPIALLEGMAYGKIPVVSRIPSIEEVLNKHNVGLWSDVKNVQQVADNMLLVETCFDTVKEHGVKARSIVEMNYTWPQICDLYLEIARKF